MDGNKLTIEQISELSGLSIRHIKKCIKRGEMRDQTLQSVGIWLNDVLQERLSKPKKRVGFRTNRDKTVHRKWD